MICDLKIGLQHTRQRPRLIESLKKDFRSRVFHPGSNKSLQNFRANGLFAHRLVRLTRYMFEDVSHTWIFPCKYFSRLFFDVTVLLHFWYQQVCSVNNRKVFSVNCSCEKAPPKPHRCVSIAGVSTQNIISVYISAVKALRELDPSGVVMEMVLEPCTTYLT